MGSPVGAGSSFVAGCASSELQIQTTVFLGLRGHHMDTSRIHWLEKYNHISNRLESRRLVTTLGAR